MVNAGLLRHNSLQIIFIHDTIIDHRRPASPTSVLAADDIGS